MFRFTVARGFHPCDVSKSFSNIIHISVPRHGQASARLASGYRGQLESQELKSQELKSQEHCCRVVVRRSFLQHGSSEQVQSRPEQPLVPSRWFSSSSSKHSDEGNLVYTGNLGKAVLGVKMFSYTSSGCSLGMMPYLLLKTGLGMQGLALQVVFCGIIGFFTFITPVFLHLITRGYVVRLYHRPDTDTYTAVTVSAFLLEKKTVFHQRQVKIPGVSKMFTTLYAGKKGLLVNPMLFSLPQDYNHLMGYDRPFSFDTDDVDEPDKS